MGWSEYPRLSMVSSQIPSATEFLVNMGDGDADQSLATEVGSSGQMLDDRNLVVELPDQTDPRESWRRLINRYQSAAWVSPIVVDDGLVPHYPTGDVTVRFHTPPSDTDLEAFAERNGLSLGTRNEFVPEQASFRPSDMRGTYLPDLVDQLQSQDDVGSAWLNTKSVYKRA